MNAWRGLLLIPPSIDDQTKGICLNRRIENGLLALYDIVVRTGDIFVLLRAIHMLKLTYPQSPDFWKKWINKKFEH
ncbi:hypothetical protein K8R61_03045 [bacterium]|nr:hypothetical protein [bacterium]